MSVGTKLKSLLSGKKKYAVIAVGVGALYLLSRKRGEDVELSLNTAAVKPGEPVTASTYRLIESKRPGMEYTQSSGSMGGDLSFSAPNGGVFTRNVVQDSGGGLLVEIAQS